MNRPGSSSASMVTVALIPDMPSTTAPDRTAGQTTDRKEDRKEDQMTERPRTSGSTAHGASIPGSAAEEVDPITIVNVGHSANTSPARNRDAGDPMPSASASLASPANPAVMISASQSRSVSQTGTCASCPAR